MPAPTYKPSDVKRKCTQDPTLNQSTTKGDFRAPIVISYRDEGKGKGAYYDHHTLQRTTGHPTLISHQANGNPSALQGYIKTVTQNLKYGTIHTGRPIPDVTHEPFEGGLLVIPGRTRDNENDPSRTSHETFLINEARKRGQPILAICAGSWQLWTALGGSLQGVDDHAYGGGMMRVSDTNGDTIHNKQIHRIDITPASLLACAMTHKKTFQNSPTVNSVHWKAPDGKTCPEGIQISARSQSDPALAPYRRQGDRPMAPQNATVEAFETNDGCPILGVQWHPEAYNACDHNSMHPQSHLSLLHFMASAGDTYAMKRRVMKELNTILNQIS